MKKNILVTGGSGMVGNYLKKILPQAVYLSSKDCDLTNIDQVEYFWSKTKPEIVIHLAAKVGGIIENMENPADFYNINTLINTNVLMMSKKYNVKRFTGILSTCMYPDIVENYPMKEKDVHLGPPADSNFSYGFTKRSLLVAINAYNKQYRTKYNYLIPCNLYGEYDHFDDPNKCHFITALIRKIIDSEKEGRGEITLFGTGNPLRQFMYAGDLAKTIKIMIDKDVTESFNVATPEENTIRHMAEITLKALGKDMDIVFDTTKPDGQFRKSVSCKKMLDSVGDFDFTKLKDGVVKVYREVIKKFGE